MQTGNGIDLTAVYQLLTEVAETLRGHDARLRAVESTLNQLVGIVNEHTRRFDQAAEILNEHNRKLDDVADGLMTLRTTVSHYHNTVIGHGILLNDFEERLKRIEGHLQLGPLAL